MNELFCAAPGLAVVAVKKLGFAPDGVYVYLTNTPAMLEGKVSPL